MVYESGFTTRRTYSSRPVVSSYAVSYPTIQTRVYKTSYPIYSTYMSPRRIYSGTRVVTSPIRVVTSPTRIVSRVIHSPSPVRVVRTTTRVISSPERTTSYTYSTPSSYYSSSYLPTPNYYSTYIPSSYVYSTPSYFYSPISRVYTRSVSPIITSPLRSVPSYLKRIPPGYGARALTNYLNTEPYTTFKEETNRIRHRAQSLVREIHTPVIRRARSCTPFPVTGYTYQPTSQLALDAYVARITNPIRHVAKEVHNISYYPEPARKYVVDDLDPFRPSRRFSAPKSLDDPIGDETKEKQRLRQERLMTVNEEALDEIDLEKKKAQSLEEAKRRQEKALQEKKLEEKEKKLEATREAEKSRLIEEARLAEEAVRKAEEVRRLEEDLRVREEERKAEEARRLEEDIRIREEERKAEEARRLEEDERILEEERKAEEARRLEEDQRALEEERKAEEARRLEEDQRVQEEERKAEEARRLEDEQRIRQEELYRLTELEKQAQENCESELARQASELSEIARQEGEIVAQELKDLQRTERDEADVEPENISTVPEEAIVDEPQSPVQEAPLIELSSIIDEVNSDNDGAFESDAEVEE